MDQDVELRICPKGKGGAKNLKFSVMYDILYSSGMSLKYISGYVMY